MYKNIKKVLEDEHCNWHSRKKKMPSNGNMMLLNSFTNIFMANKISIFFIDLDLDSDSRQLDLLKTHLDMNCLVRHFVNIFIWYVNLYS